MPKISDRPVDAQTLKSLNACANSALKEVLALSAAQFNPATAIEALDAFVFEWQDGKRPSKEVLDPEDAPNILGSLWGHCMVTQFKWEWAYVTFHENNDLVDIAVLNPDRSLAVYPISFIGYALDKPDLDCAIALAYNMVEAKSIPVLAAKGYAHLMDGVNRIVPRR